MGSLGNVMAAWGWASVDEQLLGHSSDEGNSEICRRKRPRSGYLAAYSDTSGWWLQQVPRRGPGQTAPRGVDTARYRWANGLVCQIAIEQVLVVGDTSPSTAQYYRPIASESAASASRKKTFT